METSQNSIPTFDLVVSKLCRSWDVLRHAVDANFGGAQSKEKSEWLENVIVEFFNNNSDLDPSEVENFISEIMDNEFNLLIEDNSLINLSKNLCQCYEWLRNGGASDLSRFNEFFSKIKPPPSAPMKIVENDESGTDDDDGDESMQIDSNPIQNIIEPNSSAVSSTNGTNFHKNETDEDGWTTVSNKKKR